MDLIRTDADRHLLNELRRLIAEDWPVLLRYNGDGISDVSVRRFEQAGLLQRTGSSDYNIVVAALERLTERKGTRQLKAPTGKGAQALKLVAFLTKHHEYEAGHVGNYTAAESRDIASGANVRPNTVSDFLKREFRCTDSPRDGYIAACRNQAKLLLWLMVKHGDQLPERTESLDGFDPDSIDRKW